MNKCKSCGTEINDNDFCAITLSGDAMCESCETEAWTYSNSVVECQGGETILYRWCEDFGYRSAEYWEEVELQSVTEFKYHRTDGWRGYWDAVIGKGFTAIESGWSTGRWSDVAHKHAFNDLCDAIQSGDAEPPMKVVFAFGLTSNVFSQATTIVVREADVEAFYEWVDSEIGITPDDLGRSLR